MTHNFLTHPAEIKAWLDNANIENYKLVVDEKYTYVIDVADSVVLSNKKLSHIPVKFNYVEGIFNCCHNDLVSLEGCPEEVGESFEAHHNKLISLEGGPKSVGGTYDCSWNNLTSLEHSPEHNPDSFFCSHNNLKNLKGGPRTVRGNYTCRDNPLETLLYFPERVTGDVRFGKTNLGNIEHQTKFQVLYAHHLEVVRIHAEQQLLSEGVDQAAIPPNNKNSKTIKI